MDHHLHAARLIEEAFSYHPLLGGHCAQDTDAFCDVGHSLFRSALLDASLLHQPLNAVTSALVLQQILSEVRDLIGQLRRTTGRLAQPKGQRGI